MRASRAQIINRIVTPHLDVDRIALAAFLPLYSVAAWTQQPIDRSSFSTCCRRMSSPMQSFSLSLTHSLSGRGRARLLVCRPSLLCRRWLVLESEQQLASVDEVALAIQHTRHHSVRRGADHMLPTQHNTTQPTERQRQWGGEERSESVWLALASTSERE